MSSRTLLLIDDNPDDRDLTIRAFRKNNLGNKIVSIADGAAALDYLFATGEYSGRDVTDLPVLVLLDLNLPKVSGLDVLHRIRANFRTKFLPIVILTSSKAQQDLVGGYELGANSYVRKPVDYDAFVEAAQKIGMYWLLVNEVPP